eukprot:Hpha_TRINITY_DN22235_c0_g1::TRINITY_DN22235_c0_g1_i1::g.167186::m.167186
MAMRPEELQQLVHILSIQVQPSPPEDERRHAERQLEQWQRRPGFTVGAILIIRNAELPEAVRQLAAASLRTSVDLHWRKKAPGWGGDGGAAGVQAPEKAQAREALLALLGDPASASSVVMLRRIAMAIGRVARYDVADRHWPELLPVLQSLIGSGGAAAVRGATALHFVLYETMTNRVRDGPQAHTALCHAVAPLCYELAVATSQPAVGGGEAADLCCLAHKCMVRVLKDTLKSPNDCLRSYLAHCGEYLTHLCKLRLQAARSGADTAVLDRLMKKAMKAPLSGYQRFTNGFVSTGALPGYVQLVVQAINEGDAEGRLLPESFVLQCLTFLLHALQSATGVEGGSAALEGVLGGGRLVDFARVLLERYLAVSETDIDAWKESPEAFVFEQEMENEDVDVKAKVQEVFTGLLEDDDLGADLGQQLSVFIEREVGAATVGAPQRSLASVYHAFGMGCYALPRFIDDAKAVTLVARALQDGTSPTADNVVRWRALWAVGQWVCSVPVDQRPAVYQGLVPVLADEGTDLVLRLTALRALQYYIEDPEFKVDGLLPVLDSFISSLFSLLTRCTHLDLRENGVALVGMLVGFVGRQRFAPYAPGLMGILHQYWRVEEGKCALWKPHSPSSSPPGSPSPDPDATGVDGRVKESVMSCLSTLVQVVGALPPVHDYACQVVASTINPRNPDYEELRESGLNLWHAIVRQAESLTPQLQALWSFMPGLLERDFETFEKALETTQEYVLLGGEAWMKGVGEALFAQLLQVLRTRREQGLVIVCSILDDFYTLMPQHAAEAHPLMGHMIAAVAQNSEEEVILSQYLALFCRLVIANRASAMQLLSVIATEAAVQGGAPALLVQIVDTLLNNSDSIANAIQRKICALALVSLLVPPSEALAARIDAIAASAVEAVQGEEGDEEGTFRGLLQDAAVGSREGLPEDAIEAAAVTRRRALLAADPVATISARQWFHQHLQELGQQVGQPAFQQLLSTIAPHNRQPLGI